MNIVSELSDLGVGGKKASVYLALLQMGSASVMDVAKRAGLKRPTTYDLLEELIRLKLVTCSFFGKKRLFSADNPENLKLIPQKQQSVIENLLPSLQALYNKGPRKPRIHYYEGAKGVRFVNDDLLTVISREYFYFGSVAEMVDVMGKDYLENYVERRIKKQIWANAIRMREKEIDDDFMKGDARNLRRVRFFPKPIMEDIASLYIYDNKTAVMSAQKECYGMIIESRELALLLKAVWQCAWSIALP
jgi:sugar-specific transcriptional regulator TrmB